MEEQVVQEIINRLDSKMCISTEKVELIKSTISSVLREIGLDMKFSEHYNAVEHYKSMIAIRHREGINGIDNIFKRGVYTKDSQGNLIGARILLKSMIKNLCEAVKVCETCNSNFIPIDSINYHCQVCQPCEKV